MATRKNKEGKKFREEERTKYNINIKYFSGKVTNKKEFTGSKLCPFIFAVIKLEIQLRYKINMAGD